jgi:hypothetical protein
METNETRVGDGRGRTGRERTEREGARRVHYAAGSH